MYGSVALLVAGNRAGRLDRAQAGLKDFHAAVSQSAQSRGHRGVASTARNDPGHAGILGRLRRAPSALNGPNRRRLPDNSRTRRRPAGPNCAAARYRSRRSSQSRRPSPETEHLFAESQRRAVGDRHGTLSRSQLRVQFVAAEGSSRALHRVIYMTASVDSATTPIELRGHTACIRHGSVPRMERLHWRTGPRSSGRRPAAVALSAVIRMAIC
jgi:hypothetical protein